jgi:NSS family neurotransmitter:Na+ symporter
MSNEKHEHWGSSFGFIMAAAGSAIGLGNIWKFPYLTGNNGGGAFVLIYLACMLVIGLPIMLGELALGRATQSDPIGAMKAISVAGKSKIPKIVGILGFILAIALIYQQSYGIGVAVALVAIFIFTIGWPCTGYFATLAAIVILAYYSMIGGWIFLYGIKSFAGMLQFTDVKLAGEAYSQLCLNGNLSAGLTVVFMGLCAATCWFGVKKGIETASKVMMPFLFILLLVLVIRGLTLPGATEGVSFFLTTDFSKISSAGVLEALGQVFYSLSLAMGILITYGSYLPKERNILSCALFVGVLDTLIAIMAGIAIFPAVFTAGLHPAAGPGLIFNILPVTFATIPGGLGWLWGGIFFSLFFVAALTSGISIFEVINSVFIKQCKISRKAAVALTFVIEAILSVLICYSAVNWDNFQGFADIVTKVFGGARSCLFDLVDYIVTSWVLPLNGLLLAIFAAWVWDVSRVGNELYKSDFSNMSEAKKLYVKRIPIRLWSFFIRYIAPILVLITFLNGVGFFKK